MRRLVGISATLSLAACCFSSTFAAPSKPDITPPQVSIQTEPIPGAPFDTLVCVAAKDDTGISKAFVSVAGVIVEGRTGGTFSVQAAHRGSCPSASGPIRIWASG